MLKKDKLKKSQVAKNLSVIRKALRIRGDAPMAAFSAVTKEGLDDVWKLMKDAVKEE